MVDIYIFVCVCKRSIVNEYGKFLYHISFIPCTAFI